MLTVAEPFVAGSPTEVAVIVASLVVPLVAPAGIATLTHTSTVAPGLTGSVVVAAVEQSDLKNATPNDPPEALNA